MAVVAKFSELMTRPKHAPERKPVPAVIHTLDSLYEAADSEDPGQGGRL